MHTPWLGRRRIAVIPAIVNDPQYDPSPANWVQQIEARLFYDPDPTTGIDRSLRSYLYAASYGQALLDADVFAPVTLTVPPYRIDDAMNAVPAVSNYEYCCIVFTANTAGATGYAWMEYPWPFNPPLPPFSRNLLRNFCRVNMGESLGVWAMEVLHMTTAFGDLYNANPQPGGFDEMACSCGTHPSTYTKLKLSWLNPAYVPTLPGGSGQSFNLHALALLQPPPPGRVTAVRIPSQLPGGRYFIAEARLRVDVYESNTLGVSSGLPSEGVVVYEVDETAGPLLLRTAAALQPGQSYSNSSEQLQISVTSAIPGGFTIDIQSTENAACAGLRDQILADQQDIQSLQEDMRSATPQQKADIARRIRQAQADLKGLQEEAKQLGCVPGVLELRPGRHGHH